MYIKYKDNIGKLIYYAVSNEGIVQVIIEVSEAPNKNRIAFTCKESDIIIPNIMGNSRILYDIDKQREELEGE